MPTGTRALEDLVLKQLSQVELSGNDIGYLGGWDSLSTTLLNLALDEKIIREKKVLEVIHERLLTLGAQAYDQHAKTGTEPDHVTSPHALAYAIRHQVLTPNQLASIRFDHSETIVTFMEGQVKTLSEDVLQKLKSWKGPKFEDSTARHLCC